MKILLFDILITGHHSEYISHIVDYLNSNEDQNDYVLVVNNQFSIKFPKICQIIENIENLKLVEISQKEFTEDQKGGLIRMSFAWFKLMNQYALRFNIDHVILLYLNVFQLAFCFFRPSYTISGILFQQFHRMEIENWKDKVKYWRKYYITKGVVANKSVKRIHILNDSSSVDYFNFEFNSAVFEMLPDPVPNFRPIPKFDIYSYYGISKNRKIILHLGSLGERKGTYEVVNSLPYIEERDSDSVILLIVGKASEEKLTKLLEKRLIEYPKLIIWDNRFVSNEMMKSLFDQCDAVLMPYKNPEASSGILGHALASSKPVITVGQGLLKEIVLERRCGLLIENVDSAEISVAISSIIKLDYSNLNGEDYIKTHSPFEFGNRMLTNCFNRA